MPANEMNRATHTSAAIVPPAETAGQDGLPEWNLGDLYPSMESDAYRADLESAAEGAKAFAALYRGQLEAILSAPDAPARLHEAIAGFEALEDRLGRILSFASLLYAGDTSDTETRQILR